MLIEGDYLSVDNRFARHFLQARRNAGITLCKIIVVSRAQLELAGRLYRKGTVTFEDLGICQLMIDEADAYKNLAYVSKMQRIAGLPNSDSFRALDMFLKIRYIQQNAHTRGVVFATGTPNQ